MLSNYDLCYRCGTYSCEVAASALGWCSSDVLWSHGKFCDTATVLLHQQSLLPQVMIIRLSNYDWCCHCGTFSCSVAANRLVGLVVRRPPRERKIPGSNPACTGIFSRSSHTSDLKIGTPVATLPAAWCYRVSTGTGWPGVSILRLGEVERLICNFCLSVAAHRIV